MKWPEQMCFDIKWPEQIIHLVHDKEFDDETKMNKKEVILKLLEFSALSSLLDRDGRGV